MPRRRRLSQIGFGSVAQFAGGLVGVATAGSLVLATIEYTRQGKAERAAETIRMVDLWEHPESGALMAYQSLIDRFMITVSSLDEEEAVEISKRSSKERDSAIALLASRVVRQPGAEAEFESVVYFFTRLALCIDAELCDAKTAAIFFEDTLNTFLANFMGQIQERQTIDPHFAASALALRTVFREAIGSGEMHPVHTSSDVE